MRPRRPPPRRPPPPKRRWPRRPRAEAPTAPRRRLDTELVRRGFTAGLEEARQSIERGEVVVGGAPATNPSRLVAADEAMRVVRPRSRFVGRGGEKLAAGLIGFGIDLAGKRVIDAGSSTGGFTDCALQAGATTVVAIDVGRGQLHQRLRTDPRVEVHERTNIRTVVPESLGPLADVVVADLSFLSLRIAAEPLLTLVRPGGDLVWLVKPQFEAEKAEASAMRGVITDPQIWGRALLDVSGALTGRGATIMGLMTSPLRGADGNVEFLLHARAPVPSLDTAGTKGSAGRSENVSLVDQVAAVVASVVASAGNKVEDA